MIDHLSVGVADLARTVIFYDAALAPLGYVRLWTSERGAGFGLTGSDEPFAVLQVDANSVVVAIGSHIAFAAGTAEAVVAFHAAALSHGGHDEGAPGPRPAYGTGYYAAFVRDPDGHRLEAVFHGHVAHPAPKLRLRHPLPRDRDVELSSTRSSTPSR